MLHRVRRDVSDARCPEVHLASAMVLTPAAASRYNARSDRGRRSPPSSSTTTTRRTTRGFTLHLTLYLGIEFTLQSMEFPLRIGAVASAAGVGVQTLRYYERRGLLHARQRTSGGYREYSADAVRRVVFIRRAQAMGFTLDEIGALLALRVRDHRRCERVKESAEVARHRVRELLKSLQRMDEALERLIGACDSRTATEACPILLTLEP